MSIIPSEEEEVIAEVEDADDEAEAEDDEAEDDEAEGLEDALPVEDEVFDAATQEEMRGVEAAELRRSPGRGSGGRCAAADTSPPETRAITAAAE